MSNPNQEYYHDSVPTRRVFSIVQCAVRPDGHLGVGECSPFCLDDLSGWKLLIVLVLYSCVLAGLGYLASNWRLVKREPVQDVEDLARKIVESKEIASLRRGIAGQVQSVKEPTRQVADRTAAQVRPMKLQRQRKSLAGGPLLERIRQAKGLVDVVPAEPAESPLPPKAVPITQVVDEPGAVREKPSLAVSAKVITVTERLQALKAQMRRGQGVTPDTGGAQAEDRATPQQESKATPALRTFRGHVITSQYRPRGVVLPKATPVRTPVASPAPSRPTQGPAPALPQPITQPEDMPALELVEEAQDGDDVMA